VHAHRVGRPYVSVIIPAYNEEQRLGRSVPAIADYFRQQGIDFEILVVDDGSTDGTRRVAEHELRPHRGRVVAVAGNRGKGHAMRRGVEQAEGRWILMSDADLSTPIEEYARLAAAVRDSDLDLAIGSRGLPDSKIEVRQGKLRESMGKTFNHIMRLMTGLPFRDTQCGFKLMDRERVQPLFAKMVVDGFAFDVELLYLATRFGLRVRELPIVWRNDSRSRVSMVTDPGRMLLDVLRIRWRFRRGAYNPDAAPEPVDSGDA